MVVLLEFSGVGSEGTKVDISFYRAQSDWRARARRECRWWLIGNLISVPEIQPTKGGLVIQGLFQAHRRAKVAMAALARL